MKEVFSSIIKPVIYPRGFIQYGLLHYIVDSFIHKKGDSFSWISQRGTCSHLYWRQLGKRQ